MNLEVCRAIFSESGARRLLVGFSGGADSTAALLVARDWCHSSGAELTAVHFNHGLRGTESDGEAEAAARFAARLGVDFRLIGLRIPDSGNLEDAARRCRLAEWRRLAENHPDTAVVLGHHADDRAENLLLRLSRGGNASGLTSLRAITRLNGVRFLRPLLSFSRMEIEAFLRTAGITGWAEDSSNHDDKFRRNWLRNQLLPEFYRRFPGGRSGVQHALDALETDAAFIESAAADYWSAEHSRRLNFWRQAPPALLPRLLRRALYEFYGDDRTVSAAILKRFRLALTAAGDGEIHRLPVGGGRFIVVQKNRLAPEASVPPPASWHWRLTPRLEWGDWQLEQVSAAAAPPLHRLPPNFAAFNPDALPDELLIRAPQPGDRMIPFGRKNPVKLKKLRVARGLPSIPVLPVVAGPENELYWAPRIRHSNLAALPKQYENVVFFQIRPLK